MSIPTGRWGVWSTALRFHDRVAAMDAAAALEGLGCSGLWMTGGLDDPFPRVSDLLDATSTVTVATGILSIWTMSAADVAARVAGLRGGDRFLLGLGVSHPALVDRQDPGRYSRPLTRMRDYLGELDESGVGRVGQGSRVLAALGPKMLDLAATRATGAHPYLTTVEHTAQTRAALGPAPFLAPTQMALVVADPDRARAAARGHLAKYLQQPNYVNSWLRLGFTSVDVAHGGSDRLIDTLVAWGSPEQVAARLRDHVTAGADHVCLQVLDRDPTDRDPEVPVKAVRQVLEALS